MTVGTLRGGKIDYRRLEPTTYAEVPQAANDHFWWDECGYWSVITPRQQDVVNLIQNPSFEFNTDGWDPLGAITLTSDPNAAIFGRRGMHVQNLTGIGTSGVRYDGLPTFPTITITPGQTAYFTVWVKAPSGTVVTVAFESQAPIIGQQILVGHSSGTGNGNGEWQQFTGSVTFNQAFTPALASIQVFPRIIVDRPGAGGIYSFDVDGAMVTTGTDPISTFFDGNTNGGVWNGASNASTSTISRFSRGVGALNNFTDLGLDIISDSGWGMPPVEAVTSSFASVVGSHFQRQRYLPRTISLVGQIQGCCLSEVPQKRRVLQRRILYAYETYCNEGLTLSYQLLSPCCGSLTRRLELRECHYAGGLEGDRKSLYSERVILQFAASSEPFWIDPLESSVDLDAQGNTASTVVPQGTAPVYPIFEIVNLGAATIVQNITGDLINGTINQLIRFINPSNITLQAGESLLIHTDPTNFRVSTTISNTDYTNLINFSASTLGLPLLMPAANSIRSAFANPINANLQLSMRWNDSFLSVDDTPIIRRCCTCGGDF